ncbi:MAG: hypothetical protein SGARI_001286, partial [Bacillariaceae sp.]
MTPKELCTLLPSRSERAIQDHARIMGLSLAKEQKLQSRQSSNSEPQPKAPPAATAVTKAMTSSDSSRCSDYSDDDDKTQAMSFVGEAKENNSENDQANGNSNVPSEVDVVNDSSKRLKEAPPAPVQAPKRSRSRAPTIRSSIQTQPEVIDLVDSDSDNDDVDYSRVSTGNGNGTAPKVKTEMAQDHDD